MSHLHFFYTRCIGEITRLSNQSNQPPSRKVGVATANKMAAWKRDKVLSLLAKRIKMSKTSQESLEGRENLYKF